MTVTAPISQAQLANFGPNVIFALNRAVLAMQDMLDPRSLGIVGLRGDVAGTGTETVRITDIDDVGWARRFTQLGSETDAVTPSPITLGYTDCTVGMWALGHSQTINSMVIDRPMGHDLESILAQLPNSFAATLRHLVTTAGSGITTAIGAAGDPLDVDSWLALLTYLRELPGSTMLGMPRAMLHPVQLTQLVDSFRSEPAYGQSVAEFAYVQGVVGPVVENFAGLGVTIATTTDVIQSGGAYQGFAVAPGGVGWARASTGRVLPQHLGGDPLYLPEIGVIAARLANSLPNATAMYTAWLWIGVALASTQTHAQRRLISVV